MGFRGKKLEALKKAKILGVRSGLEHGYTAVWVVVVEDRVFVRSWFGSPSGWYHAFRSCPLGTIQIDGKDVRVRAIHTRSERLRDAVSEAYAEKYPTKASRKWVLGFARPRRAANTLELVPASAASRPPRR